MRIRRKQKTLKNGLVTNGLACIGIAVCDDILHQIEHRMRVGDKAVPVDNDDDITVGIGKYSIEITVCRLVGKARAGIA